MQEPMEPVTGVARGNLGTATNLDDTQVYAMDDLREPVDEPAALAPEPESRPQRPQGPPAEPVRPSAGPQPQPPSRSPGGTRLAGPVVVGVLAVVGIAAMITLRGGPPVAPGDLAGAGTYPPFATFAPMPTATPDTGAGTGKPGHGNGNGNGGGPKKS